MDHDTTQDLLSSYIDGDLTPDQRAEVDEHLAECEACREDLELLRLTLDALHDLPEFEAPAGFADAVMDRVEAEQEAAKVVPITRARRRVPMWAPVALAAAACVLVGLVWVAAPWRLVGHDLASEPAAPAGVAEAVFEAEEYDAVADASADEEWTAEKAREARKTAEEPVEALAEAAPAQDVPADLDAFAADTAGDAVAGSDGAVVVSRLEDSRPVPPEVASLSASEPATEVRGGASLGSTAGDTGAFYAPWESAGDGLASGEEEGESRQAEAEHRVVEEQERLRREEEAYRRLYAEDAEVDMDSDDGVVDLIVADSEEEEAFEGELTAGLAAGPAADGYDYGEYDDSDEEAEYEDEDMLSLAEPDRSRDRDRSVSRARADLADDAQVDEAPMREEADERASRTEGTRRGQGGWARKKAESRAPAHAPAAAAREQVAEPAVEVDAVSQTTAAAATGTAEWTLHTTDPQALYHAAQLCGADAALQCQFVSPYSGPVSLNAQQNYQQIELIVSKAQYETWQGRFAVHGNLLVRTEDVALAGPADLVTVKLVVEYLP